MSAWLIRNFYLVGIFGQKCIMMDLGGIYCRQSAHISRHKDIFVTNVVITRELLTFHEKSLRTKMSAWLIRDFYLVGILVRNALWWT